MKVVQPPRPTLPIPTPAPNRVKRFTTPGGKAVTAIRVDYVDEDPRIKRLNKTLYLSLSGVPALTNILIQHESWLVTSAHGKTVVRRDIEIADYTPEGA